MAGPSKFLMKIKTGALAFGVFCSALVATPGAEIHVSTSGNDSQTGTEADPVRTLTRAQELVRQKVTSQSEERMVVLHKGSFRIAAPLKFEPEDSGVTWLAAEPGSVTISGGLVISGWKEMPDGNWVAKVPQALQAKGIVRELFVNGGRRTRARTPNEGYLRVVTAAADNRTGFTFTPGDVANVPDLDQVELVFLHDWSITRVGIRSVDERNHSLVTKNPIGANARHYSINWFEPHPRYLLENSRAYIDSPGEWCHDIAVGELIYRPLANEKPGDSEIVVPMATGLIEVRGEPGNAVHNLHFDGINFEHCNWQIPTNGYAEGQANYHEPRTSASGILRGIIPAAIHFELAEDCSIRRSRIGKTGGGGIWFGSRTMRCELVDSEVYDISGNGVLVGEDTGRAFDGNPWWQAAPDQAAEGNLVESCRIHDCGRQYYGAVGVWVGLTQRTVIRDNEIFDLPYTGVSLGWMWSPTPTPNGNNRVENNHIHHVMQVLSDGGGIYTLGLQPGTVLSGNIIHDIPVNLGRAESNGMFIDEGSTSITIEGNSIYNLDRSPLRFHQAGEILVRSNLLVVKEGIPPVRYNSTKTENIKQTGNTIATESERQR